MSSAWSTCPCFWHSMPIDIAAPMVSVWLSGSNDSMLRPQQRGLRRHTVEGVGEVAAGRRQPHARQRRARHRPREELAADLRQYRVGENRVDHAAPALDLGAAADD